MKIKRLYWTGYSSATSQSRKDIVNRQAEQMYSTFLSFQDASVQFLVTCLMCNKSKDTKNIWMLAINVFENRPSIRGQRSLGWCSMVHILRQPVVWSKLFVICHHIPLLAPVPCFSNFFHLTGCAIYTFLFLTLRRKKACERKKSGRQQVKCC